MVTSDHLRCIDDNPGAPAATKVSAAPKSQLKD
jgi:hypothetical protein